MEEQTMIQDVRVTVDRIVTNEEPEPSVRRWAVILWESPHSKKPVSLDVPAEWLPDEVSEGDHLILGSVVDEGSTEEQREELQDMLENLMNRDNSPPE
jgi:hypothetical protein